MKGRRFISCLTFASAVCCQIVSLNALSPNQTVFSIGNNDGDINRTEGWSNGRLWKKMDLQTQIFFLVGLQTAGAYYASEVTYLDPRTEKAFLTISNRSFPPDSKMSEIAEQVSNFYEDPANLRIPVPYALEYSAKRAVGADDAELKAFVVMQRRYWSHVNNAHSE